VTVTVTDAGLEATVRDGVCRLVSPGARWLSTGARGGLADADAAYNVTVPDDWPRTDLGRYAARRIDRAALPAPDRDGDDRPQGAGPVLFTGVAQRHARRARLDGVEAVVTAGLSNPARLPVPDAADEPPRDDTPADDGAGRAGPGTVNVVLATDRALAPGALANLVAVVAEAKAATLLALAGVPGTTTDAVAVAADPGGEPARFSGSATAVGSAARVCVRDALAAALAARGGTVADPGDGGVVEDRRAAVSTLR
jgi:adenosylcobinamide hydrolase